MILWTVYDGESKKVAALHVTRSDPNSSDWKILLGHHERDILLPKDLVENKKEKLGDCHIFLCHSLALFFNHLVNKHKRTLPF